MARISCILVGETLNLLYLCLHNYENANKIIKKLLGGPIRVTAEAATPCMTTMCLGSSNSNHHALMQDHLLGRIGKYSNGGRVR
jgi:hypothetical protein